MEDIGVLLHCLISLLAQSCPSHELVIAVSNMVEFLLEGIDKRHPSGLYPKFRRFNSHMSLLVTIPPIFVTGKGLKECGGDLFVL
jgi:hypothetical protein